MGGFEGEKDCNRTGDILCIGGKFKVNLNVTGN
jgi:hypothetical protein